MESDPTFTIAPVFEINFAIECGLFSSNVAIEKRNFTVPFQSPILPIHIHSFYMFWSSKAKHCSVEDLALFMEVAFFLKHKRIQQDLLDYFNELCKYDDSRLTQLTGKINAYWLGNIKKLPVATKVWLGWENIPTHTQDTDSSCYSSIKMLSGLRGLDCDDINNIVKHTDDDTVCIDILNHYKQIVWDLFDSKSDFHKREDFCSEIAVLGKLSILKWARSQKPPFLWDETVLILAAENGHVEMIKWACLQTPPCPWSNEVCNCAAQMGRLNVLQWVHSWKPHKIKTPKLKRMAAANGHAHILEWIRTSPDLLQEKTKK